MKNKLFLSILSVIKYAILIICLFIIIFFTIDKSDIFCQYCDNELLSFSVSLTILISYLWWFLFIKKKK